ncbi:hypothetical protein [Sphaerisporangium corydalis]|uniref:Transporter n=1 Tax=Sphaerisporangium corydalis TaxID=1441875 RepID=A0ABV9EBA1_9ACTN|nr:hypothetical protein [Sphaerisporangium corydalis]
MVPPGDDEDDRALSPEETLRLIATQRAETARFLGGDPLLFYGTWGVAWVIGFGAYFLHYGLSGRAYAPISGGQALMILLVALALALAVTMYAGIRQGTQVRGPSQARGTMYGLTWFFAFFAQGVIGGHFSGMLPPAQAGLLWSCLSILVVSILFMAGAAVWNQPLMFLIGVWISAMNMIGVAAGPGWHALLVAAGVGGGFIVIGLVLRLRQRTA